MKSKIKNTLKRSIAATVMVPVVLSASSASSVFADNSVTNQDPYPNFPLMESNPNPSSKTQDCSQYPQSNCVSNLNMPLEWLSVHPENLFGSYSDIVDHGEVTDITASTYNMSKWMLFENGDFLLSKNTNINHIKFYKTLNVKNWFNYTDQIKRIAISRNLLDLCNNDLHNVLEQLNLNNKNIPIFVY